MNRFSPNAQSVLRISAVLLITLPAIVAFSCFAHGHGALMSEALLAVMSLVFAVGALAAYGLFNALDSKRGSGGVTKFRPVAGANSALANPISTKI